MQILNAKSLLQLSNNTTYTLFTSEYHKREDEPRCQRGRRARNIFWGALPYLPLTSPLPSPSPLLLSPSPFPSPFCPFPLLSFPSRALSLPYLLYSSPNPARSSEGALWAPPVGSGAEPWPQTHFDAFRALKTHLVATSFSRICAMQMTVCNMFSTHKNNIFFFIFWKYSGPMGTTPLLASKLLNCCNPERRRQAP